MTMESNGDDTEQAEIKASINGEVYLTENGFTMNLISEDDRKMLANHLRDSIMNFVLYKMDYGIIEKREDEG